MEQSIIASFLAVNIIVLGEVIILFVDYICSLKERHTVSSWRSFIPLVAIVAGASTITLFYLLFH